MVTSRGYKRRSRSFDEAARDAENQLQLFGLVLRNSPEKKMHCLNNQQPIRMALVKSGKR